jgi:hypothetical protein
LTQKEDPLHPTPAAGLQESPSLACAIGVQNPENAGAVMLQYCVDEHENEL